MKPWQAVECYGLLWWYDSVDEASFGGVDGLVSKQTSVFYRLSKGNINSLISSSFITSCLSSDLDVVSLSLTSRTFGKNMGSFAPGT